ncbi:phage holin family protein [Cytobacillus sp. IB215665]|uniref:phage holin family protein n=1 Tax=Cytobacillus sp. IB215665 TaxID=3097357 RepID=UPI002A166897|nr:phage holin family protein [Cytobacillus sp. IB215665]MDX8367798.1 phage holin family protein [Cytobacillus sp. IB215665]
MKHNTDTLYTFITGGAFASFAFLVGGVDKLLIAVGIFMILDYVTGIAASIEDKSTSSKTAFKGLLKKASMLSLIIVANQLDIITGNEGSFMRNAMLMFLIGTEGISLLENLAKLGVPFPSNFKAVFEQMRDKNNGGDK